jgi:UDP-glucose 4-epimerase
MRVGITGGAGFIGSNLATSLINHGYEVIVLDDLSNGDVNNIKNLPIDLIEGSITNKSDVKNFVSKIDYVVHLAARGSVPRSIEDTIGSFDINVMGTVNILEALRQKNIPLIFTSSSSVYGLNLKIPKNEKDWLQPISHYAASKLAGESLISAWSNSYNIRSLTFRLFNVFGENQKPNSRYSAVIPKWCLSALRDNTVEIFGDGEQLRDFTYVGDVVKVIVNSIENNVINKSPINLAFNQQISVNEISYMLKKVVPNLHIKHLENRTGDIKDSLSDGLLIKDFFPEIKATNFETNLLSTFQWVKDNFSF